MPRDSIPYVVDLAQKLRKRETEAEKLLWEQLRKGKLDGFKFRRQHPLGTFILDFYCDRAKLAIEIDGKYHEQDQVRRHDILRQRLIEEERIVFLRFRNEEILNDLETVLEKINSTLQDRLSNLN